MEGDNIKETALKFARKNKKKIVKELTSLQKYPADKFPTSVFMAGSPGAGKTEFVHSLKEDIGSLWMHIDTDNLRLFFEDYNGSNSAKFQRAASIITEGIIDKVLKQKQSFILDGTFSNISKAKSNIDRSLKRKRRVVIFYIFQAPKLSWKFTQSREKIEGRNIPKEIFIKGFIKSREVIKQIQAEYYDKITIVLINKGYNDLQNSVATEIIYPKNIDDYIPNTYTTEELIRIL